MDPGTVHGELLRVPERLILAPAQGSFRPARNDPDPDGDQLAREEVIGFVEGRGSSTPVHSLFPGRLMGFLALAGQRVRENQPVAWLRVAIDLE